MSRNQNSGIDNRPNPDAGLNPVGKGGGSDAYLSAAFSRIDGSYASSEEASQQLLKHTNEAFKDLGITLGSEKKMFVRQDNSHICAGCQKPVQGRVLQAMDKTWHPDCFQCSQCARAFDLSSGQGFIVRKGKTGTDQPWCKGCVTWADKEKQNAATDVQSFNQAPVKLTSQVTAPSTFAAAAPAPRGDSSEDAHGNIQQGKEYCGKCNMVIMGLGLGHNNKWYHDECFTCVACGIKVSASDGFIEVLGEPWHQDCYEQSTAARCGTCQHPIVGKLVTVDGVKHHKECYVCSVCRGSLSAGFVVRSGSPVCTGCAGPAQSSSTSVNMRGIRVDPVTQQVRDSSVKAPAFQAPTLPPPAAAKKFCTNCGSPVERKFCGNCGASTGL